MKRNWVVAMLVTGILLGRIPAFGRHSFAAEFDDTKPVKVKGTITAMRWSNPHAWIHIDVKEADGKVANYAFEMGGINQLYRSGWKKEDLPIGAEVTIDGYLSRTDPRSEEHTSELQSRLHLVCRLLLEKKKNKEM